MASRDPIVISPLQALADKNQFDGVIDVRSPAEYALDHFPAAINLPVLSNDERIQVGTAHKRASAFEGSRLGAALVARNIADIIDSQLADKPRTWRPLIYCWRGGQRSQSLAIILARIGWRTFLLDDGYQGYRRAIVEQLSAPQNTVPFVVIAGRTGTAKSLVLGQLAAAGEQVLDLEGLARHKGSVLGGLPNNPQPSQKAFESAVATVLRTIDPCRPVYVESESKKVGGCHVPDQVMVQMRASPVITIEASVPWRANYLLQDYQHFTQSKDVLFQQLDCLIPLHGSQKIAAWKHLAEQSAWPAFVTSLLNEHYDPAYDKAIARNFKAWPSRAPDVGTAVTENTINSASETAAKLRQQRCCTMTEQNPHLAASQAADQIIAMRMIEVVNAAFNKA